MFSELLDVFLVPATEPMPSQDLHTSLAPCLCSLRRGLSPCNCPHPAREVMRRAQLHPSQGPCPPLCLTCARGTPVQSVPQAVVSEAAQRCRSRGPCPHLALVGTQTSRSAKVCNTALSEADSRSRPSTAVGSAATPAAPRTLTSCGVMLCGTGVAQHDEPYCRSQ